MINPNKSYKQRQLATIIKIDAPTAYIPYITIKTDTGQTYEGSAERAHSQWVRLKVGQTVGFELQWSIVADKPMISRLIRKQVA